MFWENRFLASCETLRSRVFSCVLVFISVSIVHFKKQGEREREQNRELKTKSNLQEELVPVLRLERLMDRFDSGLLPLSQLGGGNRGFTVRTTWMCWPTNNFSHLVHSVLCASRRCVHSASLERGKDKIFLRLVSQRRSQFPFVYFITSGAISSHQFRRYWELSSCQLP